MQSSAYDFYKMYKNATHCPYCDIELEENRGKGQLTWNSKSFDRINNEKTMSILNTQVICKRCNVIKGNKTHEEFVRYMVAIADKFE